MAVKVLRLISGEEIMGDVSEKEDGTIYIKDVC